MKDNLITYKEAAEILGYSSVASMRNSIYKGYLKLNKYKKRRWKIERGASLIFFDKDEVLEVKKQRDIDDLFYK